MIKRKVIRIVFRIFVRGSEIVSLPRFFLIVSIEMSDEPFSSYSFGVFKIKHHCIGDKILLYWQKYYCTHVFLLFVIAFMYIKARFYVHIILKLSVAAIICKKWCMPNQPKREYQPFSAYFSDFPTRVEQSEKLSKS